MTSVSGNKLERNYSRSPNLFLPGSVVNAVMEPLSNACSACFSVIPVSHMRSEAVCTSGWFLDSHSAWAKAGLVD